MNVCYYRCGLRYSGARLLQKLTSVSIETFCIVNGLLFHTENAQPCIGIVFTCIKFQSCIELIKDISDNLLFCFEIYDILRWITQYFADVCDRMTANLRAASACCSILHYWVLVLSGMQYALYAESWLKE